MSKTKSFWLFSPNETGSNRHVIWIMPSCTRTMTIRGLVLIQLALCACLPWALNAQTEWKENYVTLAPQEQTNPSLARPSSADYTVTVWEDTRDSGGLITDIYAQKIDNINGLPMWLPVDGVPVCRAPYNQHNPRAAYDTLGHVMIVWEDERCDTNKPAIYAQCLNVSDGSVVTNWLLDGNRVSDTTQHAERPRLVGTGDGAYIAWEDWRNWYSSHPDSLHRDIYLQFLYSATAIYPQGGNYAWTASGTPVPLQSRYDNRNVELDRDSHWMQAQDSKDRDGVVLVYESKRAWSNTINDSIYVVVANCFDPDGFHDDWWLHQWGNRDVRCADNDEEQLNPRIVVEGQEHGVGDTTAVIVWQDARENPANPIRYHIYGQVLSRFYGTRVGDRYGIGICTVEETQRNPELTLFEVSEGLGGSPPYLSRVVCVWEDLREYGSRGIDVYCAVLDGANGTIVTAAGTAGEEVCTTSLDQDQPQVDHFPGDDEVYFVWRNRVATDDIWYQSLDLEYLQFSQQAGIGTEVTGAKGDQVNPQVGGNVFVFADHRRQPIEYDSTEDWNIYAETPGECVGPKGMNWRDMFAEVTPYSNATHMRTAVDGSGNTFVVWEEGTTDNDHNVYIQKLDVDGVPRWPNSGIRLNTTTAFHPEVTVSDSTGGAQVVWQQSSGGSDSVYYAKLSPMGAFTYYEFVGLGSKPVIDYTDSVWIYGGSKIIAPHFHAFIANVNNAGGIDYHGNADGTDWQHDGINYSQLGCTASEVQIKSSLGGGCYLAVIGQYTGNPHLSAVAVRNTNSGDFTIVGMTVPYFYGADIERDDNGNPPMWEKYGCIVACGAMTANTNFVSFFLDADSKTVNGPHALIAPGQYEWARYPAICPDSSRGPVHHDGGILAAWDWEYINGKQVHTVQTNRLSFDGTNWVFTDPTIGLITHFDSALYPDIARIRIPGDTAALIVFEGQAENCASNRPINIEASWVLYDSSSIHRGLKWIHHNLIGPGEGNYSQRHPMVRTSMGNSANVFWYDSRGPVDLVMGTRTWVVDSIDIEWGKIFRDEVPVPIATIRLGESYPNPVSLSRSSVSSIIVETASEQSVRLELFDNLGRLVGVVHDGLLQMGRHELAFDVSHLSPGMYHYLLWSSEGVSSRGLIVVR